ncbi:MAG: 2-amino-3,7-dideoxy-D-threo-hept-6-ulosonate synthase [Candidatus Micrarchaeia archaeon]
MVGVGMSIRLDRIMNRNTKRTVIVPMDHGVTMGPIEGLTRIRDTINSVVEGGANAVVLHKGVVRSGYRGYGKDVGLIIHMSGSTELADDPLRKVSVCTVEEAIKLGADGVSVHINMGGPLESFMLQHLTDATRSCTEWGLPLLAMMYPRGGKAKEMAPEKTIPFITRVAYELGASIIKVPYTGDVKSFSKVVESVDVPVIIAGGSKVSTEESLRIVKESIDAGGAGVACGRNVFQHDDPRKMVRAIARIVHENATVKEAMEELE